MGLRVHSAVMALQAALVAAAALRLWQPLASEVEPDLLWPNSRLRTAVGHAA